MVIRIRQGQAEDGGFIIKNNVHITRRELEALKLIGMGLDNNEVAQKLGVKVNTVRNHIWNVMQKLGATSRANAIVLAVQNGLFDVAHKRSLETYVPGFDCYVLCVVCGKAALADDYKEVESEDVTINHVDYKMDYPARCPTEGCNGDFGLTVDWEEVRQLHPEYPEIPEKGVEYDTDAQWMVSG